MINLKFHIYCSEIVQKLGKDKTEQFGSLTDDASRVKFMFEVAEQVKFDLATWTPKDFDRAEALKVSGNKLFQQRSNFQAINIYNEALTRCPQDYVEGQSLYAILIANRSAVFFDNGEYHKVLKDAAFLKQYGHHPSPEKIIAREKKALDFLYNAVDADVIEFEEDGSIKLPLQEEWTWSSKNLCYPALSSKVAVKEDDAFGRYIIAKQNIKSGEIIAIEKAYASIISGTVYRTNCAHCTVSTNQIHACATCCQAVFCSLKCLEFAKIYHQHECSILLTLFDAGVSVNNLLALRMVTQRPLQQVIKEEAYASEEKNVVIYKTEDYYNVSRLVRHEDASDSEDMRHLTFMAILLLKLLRKTDYFGSKEGSDLSENEVFIGRSLLKYLQILRFNAHEIFELQNVTDGKIGDDTLYNQWYQTGDVGAGIYPTLALFNHSCDPSVIRYNIRNTMVLRSIKPIKAGEIVYENYGSLYVSTPKSERISKMAIFYRFNCICQACVEDWPMFKDFDQGTLRVVCDCGGVIPTSKDISTPSVTCPNCDKDKNILPVLTSLMVGALLSLEEPNSIVVGFQPLEPKTNKAEELISGGNFEEARILFGNILDTHLKVLAAPYPDMVQIQNRLKACLLHRGDKKFDYHLKI